MQFFRRLTLRSTIRKCLLKTYSCYNFVQLESLTRLYTIWMVQWKKHLLLSLNKRLPLLRLRFWSVYTCLPKNTKMWSVVNFCVTVDENYPPVLYKHWSGRYFLRPVFSYIHCKNATQSMHGMLYIPLVCMVDVRNQNIGYILNRTRLALFVTSLLINCFELHEMHTHVKK